MIYLIEEAKSSLFSDPMS